MKELGFMVVAGLVSGILSRFLPPVPGLENTITLIGTLSAVAGGAIGILFRKLSMWRLVGLILVALVVSIFGLLQFRSVATGVPGPVAANWIYFWTVMTFLPIGILVEAAGLKVSS